MISDDKIDDEFLDDDLDIEELDDLDDLDDDDWDDLGEDEEQSAPAEKPAKAAKPVKVSTPKGDKTFVQKNFYPIVGGVVVLAGGLFAYGQMGGKSSPPVQPDISASVPALDNADMPPMPAPMEAPEEDMAHADVEAAIAPPANEDPVLTPMPAITGEAEMASELPELTLTEETTSEVPLEPAPEIEQAEIDILPEPVAELSPTPEADEDTAAIDSAFTEPVLVAPAQEDPLAIDATTEVNNATPEPVAEEAPQLAEVDEVVVEPAIKAVPEAAPELDNSKELELLAASEDLKAQVSEKDQELQELKESMEAELALANEKIAALNGTISELESQVNALKAAPTPAPVAGTTPSPAPKPEVKAVAEAPRTAPKPAAAPNKPAVSKISWTLRSAQNGKATLSSSTSGGLYNAEVGDTLPGLGKITSVSKVGGKWVVQGTQGRVTQ